MDVDCAIPSNMISRRHAILQKSESGRWTIMDNNVKKNLFNCFFFQYSIYVYYNLILATLLEYCAILRNENVSKT